MGGPREALEEVYGCWSRGDFRTPLALFESLEEYEAGPGIPDRGVWRGQQGLVDYSRDFLASWRELVIEALDYEISADHALVRVRQVGTGRASGARTEFVYFHVWTLREGRIVRLQTLGGEEEQAAREAAGVPARAGTRVGRNRGRACE